MNAPQIEEHHTKELLGYPKDVTIICPSCGLKQPARIHFYVEDPFDSYVHFCTGCGYIIMESDWEAV